MGSTPLDLRIVPLDTLVLHEKEEDGRREKLRERITAEGVLRNPIITANIGNGDQLLILDGVHRYFALKDLKCRDALVQVVNYLSDNIQLYTWCRLITNLSSFLKKIETLGLRVREVEEKDAVTVLESGKAYGYVRTADGPSMLIEGDKLSLNDKTEKLQQILNSHNGLSRVRCEEIDQHIRSEDVEGGLVVEAYTKSDVLELARSKTKLPAGTTRHIIPDRVLNIDVSLDLLKANMSIEDKNKDLADRINKLAAEGRIRYYPEPVWLFDE